MRNKLLLLLLLMFMTSGMMYAQQQKTQQSQQRTAAPSYTLKGVLLDSLTQEGEPYATIKIAKKNAPQKALKMAVTDLNGKFQEKLTVAPGEYIITLSSVGKVTIVKDFTVKASEKVIDLGKLNMAEATNELKGIEVVAQKPLVKVDVDKIEYNIEDDPDSKTNTVMEMLRKVPLVTVDGEDNIKVNGSSSFKIHVNGKPNNMMSNNPKDVLKSMPANTIKHIEVITSPGAKYDAEGVGGILNIVTVGGGFEGYTATFRASGSNRGAGAGGYATIKSGKLTITGNYNYNYDTSPKSYSDSYRENYDSEDQKYLESKSSSDYNGSFQYGNLEASYEIDTLRLLTASFGMYGGANDNKSDGLTTMWNAQRDRLAYQYRSLSDGDGSWYSMRGNVDYQRTSKKNKDRMITLSYKISTQPQNSDYYTDYKDINDPFEMDIVKKFLLNNSHSDGKTNTTEHTFQVDYTTPIGKLHTIEAGAKYIIRNNLSDNKLFEAEGVSDNYEYNNDRSSKYKHLNDILAAYLGYTLRYKTFSFKPGVRYEYTSQDVKYLAGAIGPEADFSTSYNDFVPSVTMGIKIGKTQNLRGGYNMRIWRPGIWNLNPYFDDRNPMFISQGNSNLESEKSHSFNLSYSMFSMKFNVNISLRHSFGNNGIERVSRLIGKGGEEFPGGHHAPEGALYSTYENIGKNRNTGLSLYGNWNASPNTRIYLNGDGSYVDIKSPAQGLHNYGWNASLYGGIQHTFPLKIRASLNAGGSTPYISLQGKGSGYYYYSLGVNRSFIKDRFTVSAYVSNIFEKYRSYNNTTMGENFLSKSSSRYQSRSFGISLSYRIGELKASVKKAARSINNDDVKGGGGQGGQGGGAN